MKKGSAILALPFVYGCFIWFLFDISLVFFPMDAFYRASFHRFFNAIFEATFGKYDFGFFFIFVECKDLRAKFDTALTAYTFISIYDNPACHFETPPFDVYMCGFIRMEPTLKIRFRGIKTRGVAVPPQKPGA
jgi:hypothetical protein